MEYKSYCGHVAFDDERGVFHGEVLGLRDVVTFQGKSVADLRKAFRESVDDYLEFCRDRGEDPEKPVSGRFVLRVSPELHRQLLLHAKRSGKSLNAWIVSQLENDLAQPTGAR
ncbi:MAG: type II toxin-antitoxin system HicB family antitoxin [Pirellulales bacterium]|nr:type II toxin-antitoxin system HicB family antitoxin [Pirellulales bacterium]